MVILEQLVFGNATADTIGVTNGYDLGVIDITGNLDLNAAIGNGATAGATSIMFQELLTLEPERYIIYSTIRWCYNFKY